MHPGVSEPKKLNTTKTDHSTLKVKVSHAVLVCLIDEVTVGIELPTLKF
jgi:hypothetical protein